MSYATDVFVVGGGPAGLAAAIAARQRGLRVIVADGMRPPIDKACGEGFLPDGLAAVERLGLQLPLGEAYPFRGVRFLNATLAAESLFPGAVSGMAVRRTVLHRIVMERAEQLGTEFMWGAAVSGISANGVRVGATTVRTRWIVGADGANSRVRGWAGLNRGSRPRLRYAFRQHYRVRPWTDHMEVYWGDRCQGYATAVGEDLVCVALASHDPKLRLQDGLRELPRLNDRLRGAEIISSERGALTGNRGFARVWKDNVALIGDASGTVDAITGEGIGLAFTQAAALADCMARASLAPYQVEHRRMMLRPRAMARLMLNMDGKPWLQRRTLQVFQTRPEIFHRLVELHVGARSPLDIAFALDGLMLGWGLLTA